MMSGSGSGDNWTNGTTTSTPVPTGTTTSIPVSTGTTTSIPVSTGTTTTIPVPTEPISVLASSLAGIVLVSLAFLVTVLICKKIQRKKDMKFVHEQQKRKNGSQGSVYFVRGQGIQLQSSRPRSSEFVNVLENINIAGQTSQQHLSDSTNSLTPNKSQMVEVNVENVVIHDYRDCATRRGEGGGNGEEQDGEQKEDGGPGGSEKVNAEASLSRGQPFSRRSDARSSVRSESGLKQRRQEPENVRYQISRQMSARMSKRSEAGHLAKRQLVHGQQSTTAATDGGKMAQLKQLDAGVIHEVLEDNDYHGGSRSQKFSIHQVQSHSLQEDSRIPIDGLRVQITSPFSEIPSFKDPELTGDDDNYKAGLLGLPAPPDIYSSQILDTVEQQEEAEDVSDTNEECVRVITETNQHRRSLDRIISIEPPTYDSDDDEPMRPDPRYSCLIIRSRPQSVEHTENLYDEPIFVTTPNSERFLLAAPIFDDPGYDKGFKSMGSRAATSNQENNNTHHYHTLEPQFITGKETTTRMEDTGEAGMRIENERRGTASCDRVSDVYLASDPPGAQLSGKKELTRSTLALLDFGEEELQDMDPDLLSHLQREDENDAM